MDSELIPKPGTEGERLLAAASYLTWFVGFPLVGPAIVYYLKRDESPEVARHAAQALVLCVLTMVLQVVTVVAGYALMFGAAYLLRDREGAASGFLVVALPVAGWALVFVEGLLFAVASAFGAVKAYRSEPWTIPIASGLARAVFRVRAGDGVVGAAGGG